MIQVRLKNVTIEFLNLKVEHNLESRMSSQTKSSGLSLKDLIHAEISKRPTKPSKKQINALSRNSKSKT